MTTDSTPILWNHNPNDVIGVLRGGVITFQPGRVTRELIGGMGLRILEQIERDGVMYITKAELVEISCYADTP